MPSFVSYTAFVSHIYCHKCVILTWFHDPRVTEPDLTCSLLQVTLRSSAGIIVPQDCDMFCVICC